MQPLKMFPEYIQPQHSIIHSKFNSYHKYNLKCSNITPEFESSVKAATKTLYSQETNDSLVSTKCVINIKMNLAIEKAIQFHQEF